MNAIQMTPVTSSLIRAIGHDVEKNILAVELHQGGAYHYANFTEKDYADLRTAPSVGSHFSRFVKGKYDCQRVSAIPATFDDMLEALRISGNEQQAEIALKAIMNSPDYSDDEKTEAAKIFNERHAVVIGD